MGKKDCPYCHGGKCLGECKNDKKSRKDRKKRKRKNKK